MTLKERLIIYIQELEESIDWYDQTDYNSNKAEAQKDIVEELAELLKENPDATPRS